MSHASEQDRKRPKRWPLLELACGAVTLAVARREAAERVVLRLEAGPERLAVELDSQQAVQVGRFLAGAKAAVRPPSATREAVVEREVATEAARRKAADKARAQVRAERIVAVVAAGCNHTVAEVAAGGKDPELLRSRRLAMAAVRALTGLAYPRIAALCGRVHPAAMEACRWLAEQRAVRWRGRNYADGWAFVAAVAAAAAEGDERPSQRQV